MYAKIKLHRNLVVIHWQKETLMRFNTGIKVLNNKSDWNKSKCKINDDAPNSVKRNQTIKKWLDAANTIIEKMMIEGVVPKGHLVNERMINLANNINESHSNHNTTINEWYEEFFQKKKQFILENPNKSDASLQDYVSFRNSLIDYERDNGKSKISDIDEGWLSYFHLWLSKKRPLGCGYKTKGGLGKKSIKKRFDTLKSLFIYLQKNGVVNNIEFLKSYSRENVKTLPTVFDTLSKEEINAFYQYDFKNERLNKIRDLWVFSAKTSLRFQDLITLNKSHILPGYKLVKIAHKTRNVNAATYQVSLSKIAIEIIKRHDFDLDFFDNSKANEYLKEALEICGMFNYNANRKDEKGHPLKKFQSICMHDARRSFISIMVNAENPLPYHKIMMMTAHTKVETLYKYIDKSGNTDVDMNNFID